MDDTLSYAGSGGSAPPLRQRMLRLLLVLGMAGMLGLVGGGLSSLGRPELTAIAIGLVVAALAITSRVAVFWFVVIGALVVTGLAQLYLPGTGARYVRYVVPVASLALLLHWVADRITSRSSVADQLIPNPMAWAFVFAFTALTSVLVNLGNPSVAAVGIKNYFQMWPFFLGVAFLRWNPSFDRKLMWGLLLIALLQLPFAAHQYLFLAPMRVGLGGGKVPVDIVAGTFGATLFGGGANAVLAAFQIIVVAGLLALWKNGAMSLGKAAMLSLLLLTPMLVNQAKVSVLYLLLIFVVLFHREIIMRPGKFLLAAVGMTGVLAVFMTALMLTQPGGRLDSWSAVVDWTVNRQMLSVEEREHMHLKLTRWTALTFWAKEHVEENPARTLVGHGLGASLETDAVLERGKSLAEKRYPGLGIGHTAAAALLWDTGLIGFGAVMGMFAAAFFMAGRLARHYRGTDPVRTALFEALQAAMPVLGLSLAHKDFFIVHLPFQAFAYLLVGFIANAWLQVRGEDAGNGQKSV